MESVSFIREMEYRQNTIFTVTAKIMYFIFSAKYLPAARPEFQNFRIFREIPRRFSSPSYKDNTLSIRHVLFEFSRQSIMNFEYKRSLPSRLLLEHDLECNGST